jgi:non-ribosomal peptide synthetase component F
MPRALAPASQALKGISTHEVRGHKWPLFHSGDRVAGLIGLHESASGSQEGCGQLWNCATQAKIGLESVARPAAKQLYHSFIKRLVRNARFSLTQSIRTCDQNLANQGATFFR